MKTRTDILKYVADSIGKSRQEFEEYRDAIETGRIYRSDLETQFGHILGKLYLARDLILFDDPLDRHGLAEEALVWIESVEGYSEWDEDEDEEFPHIRSLYDQDVGDLQ